MSRTILTLLLSCLVATGCYVTSLEGPAVSYQTNSSKVVAWKYDVMVRGQGTIDMPRVELAVVKFPIYGVDEVRTYEEIEKVHQGRSGALVSSLVTVGLFTTGIAMGDPDGLIFNLLGGFSAVPTLLALITINDERNFWVGGWLFKSTPVKTGKVKEERYDSGRREMSSSPQPLDEIVELSIAANGSEKLFSTDNAGKLTINVRRDFGFTDLQNSQEVSFQVSNSRLNVSRQLSVRF
jgi:hypothetical protein